MSETRIRLEKQSTLTPFRAKIKWENVSYRINNGFSKLEWEWKSCQKKARRSLPHKSPFENI